MPGILAKGIICHGNTLEYGDWLPISKSGVNNGIGKANLIKLGGVKKEYIIEIIRKTNWKVSGEKEPRKYWD